MAAAIFTVATAMYPPGNRRGMIVDFTPSTSYPAGGEPMTASLFGLQAVDNIVPAPGGNDGTRVFTYDAVNNKLRIFTAIGTEAVNGTDQSGKVVRLQVFGL
jgi:hypothetical protein